MSSRAAVVVTAGLLAAAALVDPAVALEGAVALRAAVTLDAARDCDAMGIRITQAKSTSTAKAKWRKRIIIIPPGKTKTFVQKTSKSITNEDLRGINSKLAGISRSEM